MPQSIRNRRVLYCFGHPHPNERRNIVRQLAEIKKHGYLIEHIIDRDILGIDVPWPAKELDALYAQKYPPLIKLYNTILAKQSDFEIFISNHGNVYHPEFILHLRQLGKYTVLVSADDPESSDICSKPYVKYFDHSFSWGVYYDKEKKIIQKFYEWGSKRANIWPYGVSEEVISDTEICVNKSLPRDIDVIFIGNARYKIHKLGYLKHHFHNTVIYGRGWSKSSIIKSPFIYFLKYKKISLEHFVGAYYALKYKLFDVSELPDNQHYDLYRKSKIGFNTHLSFGPSNRRTYDVPACGAMLISDCKKGLDELFEINKDVVAYDSIYSLLKKINYYLKHSAIREIISTNGFNKIANEYTFEKVFKKAYTEINSGIETDNLSSNE